MLALQRNIYNFLNNCKIHVDKEETAIYLQLIGTAFWFGHTICSVKKPVQLLMAYSWIWNAS